MSAHNALQSEAYTSLALTGFAGHKLKIDDMVQLACNLGFPADVTYVLAPRVYMISGFVPHDGKEIALRCKLSNGWVCNPARLVRTDKVDEILKEEFCLLRYPTFQESTFRMEPMLNDKELELLQLLREKPGKAATLKNPADQMPDMYKRLTQRGYCRIADELLGPLRVKTGQHMILLTEAGEMAMTAQLLTSSKDMESHASYECPNGHEMVNFKNGQPVCQHCSAEMKRIA